MCRRCAASFALLLRTSARPLRCKILSLAFRTTRWMKYEPPTLVLFPAHAVNVE